MYQFERMQGESITAYRAFIYYREGKNLSPTKQQHINRWKLKWNWEERRIMYKEFIDSEAKNIEKKAITAHEELQVLLIELRRMLVSKVEASKDEIDSLSGDSLVKLISLCCRAIMDIAKAERDLEINDQDEQDWGELASLIRNNPNAIILAKQLSTLIYK